MKRFTARALQITVFIAAIFFGPGVALSFTMDFTFTGNVPAAMQTAINHAGSLWEGWLLDTNTGENEDVEITIDYKDLGSGILGSAGPSYWWYDSNYAYLPAMGSVLYGAGDTDNEDGVINFSNRFSWYTGTDGNPGAGQYDVVSVALHEIGHQVGIFPTYNDSTSRWGVNVSPGQYRLSHWDSFLRDEAGNAPEAGQVNDDFNETDNPVYFIGSNANTANGGEDVPVYAPSTYNGGSSLAHLDEQAPYSGYLMSYSLNTAEAIHGLSSVEVGLLQDLGWNVVPEPSAVLLFALGGFALRRRRR